MMMQIRLMGQLDVRLNSERVLVPSRSGQLLLAYLALTSGTSHPREEIARMFWPETSDANARKNLRYELWRIRKAISVQQSPPADYLLANESTITFNRAADHWLDVSQFESGGSDLASLTSDLALY